MDKAWCPGCQRGNSYDKNGECLDCGSEIASPYKYKDMDGKEDSIMDDSYVKGEGIDVVADVEDVGEISIKVDKKKRKMSEATKAKIKATRAKNKAKKGSA